MVTILLLAILGQDLAVRLTPVTDVAQVAVLAPKQVAALDMKELGGDPVRLAWGPNGQFYLRIVKADRWGNETSRHFIVRTSIEAGPSRNGTLSAIDAEPAWAASYWLWKSSMFAPGARGLELETEVRKQLVTPTGLVVDGGYSQHSRDLSPTLQNLTTTMLKLKREVVAVAVNTRLVPGLSFSWAPAAMGVLAYIDTKGRLRLIDREGRTREVPGGDDAWLPAWSTDGRQIAYLQKADKKKYSVMVVDVVVGR